MTIRTRLTLWYSGMLLVSLLLMGGVLYYELVYEHRPQIPRRQRERTPKQIADILFLYGAPTLLLLLGGGWFLMRRTLAPIQALTTAADRVHAENVRDHLPQRGNGDELDRLTGVFNAMLSRLDDSFRHIRSFTLHASHELKTPLTILRGEMESLLRDARTHPEHRESMEGMLDEMQRLVRIVDDLSLLTKAATGQETMIREGVSIDELVREACEDAVILGEKHHIKIEVAHCAPVRVTGDRHRLRQLLLNLVDNAVKHNRINGSVTISLQQEGREAHLYFENTGPGIASEQLSHVFDPFFLGKEARLARTEGCGLGLSIAKWIVEAHQGSISISSTAAGLTRITLRLPIQS